MNKRDNEDKNTENHHNEDCGKGTLNRYMVCGCIFILLAAAFILLFMRAFRSDNSQNDEDAMLQQKISDYAKEQEQNDGIGRQKALVTETFSDTEDGKVPVYDSTVSGNAKTAVVVDIEDENDIAYTKEFILKEMTPYFEENNLEAVWDLAHLKRYVRLSEGLKGSGTYYYQGDVDSEGLPDGKGLAIYENNTYYYGSWSHGLKSGDGRWCRFYINASDKLTENKKYQAHSYAGEWKDDLPNGDGAEHYDVDITRLEPRERIKQNVVGNFTNGLYDGYMFQNTVDNVGLVEEWYGNAADGVFDSWEDISSLGEYFAWQNAEDKTLYIKIDGKDNKNQGIREIYENNDHFGR